MPSGYRLTEQQVDRILKLAGELDSDGNWLLSYRQIASRLDLHRHTVETAIRQAAVNWGKHTAWKDPLDLS
jgi:DNA invertase Pin-like site-specific DNA recombinase